MKKQFYINHASHLNRNSLSSQIRQTKIKKKLRKNFLESVFNLKFLRFYHFQYFVTEKISRNFCCWGSALDPSLAVCMFAFYTASKYKKQLQACNFIKKETLAQVFSCEFCEISKNSLFYRTARLAASGKHKRTFVFWGFQGIWNENIGENSFW